MAVRLQEFQDSERLRLVDFLQSEKIERIVDNKAFQPHEYISVAKEQGEWTFQIRTLNKAQQASRRLFSSSYPDTHLINATRAFEEASYDLLDDLNGGENTEVIQLKNRADAIEKMLFEKLLKKNYIQYKIEYHYDLNEALVTVLKDTTDLMFNDFTKLLSLHEGAREDMAIIATNF